MEAVEKLLMMVESGVEFGVVVEYPCHCTAVPDVVAVGGEAGLSQLPGFAETT